MAISFALMALSTDLVSASLPGVARHFGIAPQAAQFTLSAFVLGFAMAQLACGALSDRYGRRPVLVAGGTLFMLASVACALAPSVELLIAARVVQGLGCACVVVGRAVVRDIHGPEGAARMLSWISAGMAAVILTGPLIGGTLEQAFGWRAVYVFLLLTGAALVFSYVRLLPESNAHAGSITLSPRRLAAEFRVIAADRRFIGHSLCQCFSYSVVLLFLTSAPFVLISGLGLSPARFGALFALCVAGYIIGVLANGRLVNRLGARRLMGTGSLIVVCGGVSMAMLAIAGVAHPAAIFVPYFIYQVGNGLLQPNAQAGSIAPFPRTAGSAAALTGFLQQCAGVTASLLAGVFHDGSALPMALGIAIATFATFLSYRLVVRPTQEPAPGLAHGPAQDGAHRGAQRIE